MYEERFSKWQRWERRNQLGRLSYPGVYAIAHSAENLTDTPFTWHPEIVYIGMTNAAAGLKGRLKQFDNTIAGKSGHGGADRVRYKHREYSRLCQHLHVAVAAFECDPTSARPTDLRIMGDVAQFEYWCFAHFVDVFGKLPEFNNKQDALKYSLTVGRKAAAAVSARVGEARRR